MPSSFWRERQISWTSGWCNVVWYLTVGNCCTGSFFYLFSAIESYDRATQSTCGPPAKSQMVDWGIIFGSFRNPMEYPKPYRGILLQRSSTQGGKEEQVTHTYCTRWTGVFWLYQILAHPVQTKDMRVPSLHWCPGYHLPISTISMTPRCHPHSNIPGSIYLDNNSQWLVTASKYSLVKTRNSRNLFFP